MLESILKNININESFYVDKHLVQGDDKNQIHLYKSFFEPYFNITQEEIQETEGQITYGVISNKEFEQLYTYVLDFGENVKRFYIGRGEVNRSLYFYTYKFKLNNQDVYYFSDFRVFYIEKDKYTRCFLGCNRENLFKVMRRIIRTEILYEKFLANNYIPLHGACVCKKGKAIVFVGDSGTGKTTASLPLIEYFGFDMVSSDMCFFNNQKSEIVGTPEKMRILPITLKAYSPKYDYLLEMNNNAKVQLSPRFFSTIFNCNIVTTSSVEAIVFPKISPNDDTNQLIKCSESIELDPYISPFFGVKSYDNTYWQGKIFRLNYTGDLKKLLTLYEENEVINELL